MKINLLVASKDTFIKRQAEFCLILQKTEKDKFISSYPENTILRGDLKKFKGDIRSLNQLKKYWIVVKWFSENIPECIQFAFAGMGITARITPETIHAILKTQAGITSVAFDNLDHPGMCLYFEGALKYMASLLCTTPDEIMENLEELK